jgi:hypothetical protein
MSTPVRQLVTEGLLVIPDVLAAKLPSPDMD